MQLIDWIQSVGLFAGLVVNGVGLLLIWKQIRHATTSLTIQHSSFETERKAWSIDVHQKIMDLLDTQDAREERTYVQTQLLDVPNTYAVEKWLNCQPNDSSSESIHRRWAENTARRFDRLGYLWWSDLVPDSLIFYYYLMPVLRCWRALSPYIREARKSRKQVGHMWEFENLALHVYQYAKAGPEIGRHEGPALQRLLMDLEEDWHLHPFQLRHGREGKQGISAYVAPMSPVDVTKLRVLTQSPRSNDDQ